MNQENRDKWLEETEKYFKEAQSYNTTIITVGYATFFGLLVFLEGKTESPLLFLAGLLVALSAALFVGYELLCQIKISLDLRKIGDEGKRLFRFWAWFFIPSVLLAVTGSVLLVYLFLFNLLE